VQHYAAPAYSCYDDDDDDDGAIFVSAATLMQSVGVVDTCCVWTGHCRQPHSDSEFRIHGQVTTDDHISPFLLPQ